MFKFAFFVYVSLIHSANKKKETAIVEFRAISFVAFTVVNFLRLHNPQRPRRYQLAVLRDFPFPVGLFNGV